MMVRSSSVAGSGQAGIVEGILEMKNDQVARAHAQSGRFMAFGVGIAVEH